ncbi:MAG: acyl carrier protein [Oscillospiraceae bacterium]|nr:acyl carrier protein [Oscillospiraceae bacterium]
MDREQVKIRLEKVFRDVFDDDSIELSDSTTADDIDAWDSLEHISLISAVEKAFKMRFTMKEVSGMKNVGEMIDIVAERAKK